MKFVQEFRTFINKGNVVDLGVAVVLGGAFQNIVNSIVNDIIMPLITLLIGFEHIEDLKAGSFTYGKFIANCINFLIIAMVLFAIIKLMNKTKTIIKD
ncbi:MAG: hypothetical protein RLZZ318_941 [Bacteroidota bacterium]|jgi:large conductance mechanosensitive channel